MSLNIESGLATQIRDLERRLKEFDTKKANPTKVKEITDLIKDLKQMLQEKKDKKEERRKAKEQSASPVEVEAISVPNAADVGAVSQNAPAPAAAPGAPAATPDDQKVSCPLCGGLTFNDNASYQQHMAYTHASDIMPTSPGQKQDKLVASTDPKDPKISPAIIVPDSVKKHDEVVERVEKDPKIAPHIISEKEEPRFKLDDEVKPIRGGESTGKVMRWDGKDSDLVYVAWDSGPLAERDGFGGYYPKDLELIEEPVAVEADGEKGQPPHNPGPEHICPECKDWHEKHADLRTNYQGFLDDLKEERKLHYEQGNHSWVARLDQKIQDLEKSIGEKFPKEAEKTCPTCGQPHKSDSYFNDPIIKTVDLPMAKYNPDDWKGIPKVKEGGTQNATELTIMDHTPPRANSGPDAGGKDTHDEFQDEWAMPAGVELESAKGAPNSLFDANSAQHVADTLNQMVNAPYKQAQVSTLGGADHASILLTVSADPKDQWPNGILQNSRYGMFHIYNDGEVEHFSGSFNRIDEPRMNFRKRNVKNAEQLVAVINEHLAKIQPSQLAPKTSSLKVLANGSIKLSVFNKEFIAIPASKGYDISQNGKKLFNIASKDSQPMSKEQLQFCTEVELTRGYKKATLTSDVAFLKAGSKVLILAQDKFGKRIKFACMEQGLRGWCSASKIKLEALESQVISHNGHFDKVLGSSGSETLLDCVQAGPIWVNSTELLDANRPLATPESLNDLESAKKCSECNGPMTLENGKWDCPFCMHETTPKTSAKECPDCHGNFIGKEGETCPTCGRFSVQKEAIKPALPHLIPNQRMDANADFDLDTEPPMSGEENMEWYCPTCKENFESYDVGQHDKNCPNLRVLKPGEKVPAMTPEEHYQEWKKEQGHLASLNKKARACFAQDITWSRAEGYQCLNCGIKAEHSWEIKHDPKKNPQLQASLNKVARVVHRTDGWHVLSEKGKNLGGPYKSKAEAVKRLRQVEFFKHHGALRPFSKKVIAEVLTDPYQSLTDHIMGMRTRMDQVNERLQNTPAVKTAQDAAPEMDLAALFADLTQGIDLLESKLGGDDIEPELHKGVEELENRLWKLEEACGITPKLSEEEKAEPEHKEIVKDIEEKTKKEAVVTDETIDEVTTNNPSLINTPSFNPNTPAPLGISNVQPTDDDNLEIPVPMPTSPLAPGQKWVYNDVDGVYVSMPDSSDPSKLV